MKQGAKSFIITLVVIMALGGATGFLMSATGLLDKITNKNTGKGSVELPKVSDTTNSDNNSSTSDDSTTSDIDSSTKDDDTTNDNSTIDLSKIDHCTYRIEGIKASYVEQTKLNLTALKVYETQYNSSNGIIIDNQKIYNPSYNNFYYRAVSSSDFKPCDSYMLSLNSVDKYEIYFKTEYGKSDIYNFSVSEDLTLEDKDHIELLATLKNSSIYENDKLYANAFEVVKKTFNKKGDILSISGNLVVDNLVNLNLVNSDNSLTAINDYISITSTNSLNVCFTLKSNESIRSNVVTINPKEDKSSSELAVQGLKSVYNWNDSINLNSITINKIDKDRDGVQYAVNRITNFSTFLKKDNESYKEVITNSIQLDNAGSYSIYFKVGDIQSEEFSFVVNEIDSTKTQAYLRVKKQPTKTEYCEFDNKAGVKLDLSGIEVEEYYINNGREVGTPTLINDYQVSDSVGKVVSHECYLSELTNFVLNMNYKLHISKANTISDETANTINISIVSAYSYDSSLYIEGEDTQSFVEGDKFTTNGLSIILDNEYVRQDGGEAELEEHLTNYSVKINGVDGINYVFSSYGKYEVVILVKDWQNVERTCSYTLNVAEQHNYVNSELLVEDSQTFLYAIDDTISKSNFKVIKRDNYTTLRGDKRVEDTNVTNFSVYVNNVELGGALPTGTTSNNNLIPSLNHNKRNKIDPSLISGVISGDGFKIDKNTPVTKNDDFTGLILPGSGHGGAGFADIITEVEVVKTEFSDWKFNSQYHWKVITQLGFDQMGTQKNPLTGEFLFHVGDIVYRAEHTYEEGSKVCSVCGAPKPFTGLLSDLPTPADGKYILKIVDNTSKLTFTKELTIVKYGLSIIEGKNSYRVRVSENQQMTYDYSFNLKNFVHISMNNLLISQFYYAVTTYLYTSYDRVLEFDKSNDLILSDVEYNVQNSYNKNEDLRCYSGIVLEFKIFSLSKMFISNLEVICFPNTHSYYHVGQYESCYEYEYYLDFTLSIKD